MTDEPRNQTMADERPSYEAPRALRLSDQHRGTGLQACSPGTGDTAQGCSSPGVADSFGCFANGTGASFSCSGDGSGASGSCANGVGVF